MSTDDSPGLSEAQLLAAAREVVRSEAASIASVADKLDQATTHAIRLIFDKTDDSRDRHGLVAVTGVGKAGLVGQRISASFASTGTPSHFLNPVDALHGDLGRVRRNDVALILSYSGETDELVRLLDFLKRQQVAMVAITGSRGSTLGKFADITVELGKIEEVCPHGLAPTTTVNCISAVGDALVLGVMSLRKFSREDFGAFHPGGSLGRKLVKVHEAMSFRIGENFTVIPDASSVRDALGRDTTSGTGRRAGALILVDATGKLSGVFTNADLRRKLLAHANPGSLLESPIADLMTRNPKRIHRDALASEALAMLKQHRILDLPVVDAEGRPVGMIDAQDLVSLRIVE
jgi:arabinose-5-phosphate isomerase